MTWTAVIPLVALLATQTPEEIRFRTVTLPEPEGRTESVRYDILLDPLDPFKKDPRNGWEFSWLISGYEREDNAQWSLRHRIFSQEARPDHEKTQLVARMLLRLTQLNKRNLSIMQPPISHQVIDVYLSWGGEAGGEQMFVMDIENGRQRRANVIYIYDWRSFTDPLEMARELAHEYGHATLPPIGGYSEPEEWANGYLGEGLFLRWMLKEQRQGRLTPEDAMGADEKALQGYVDRTVTPLVEKIANNGVDKKLLAGSSHESMKEYLGLNFYAEQIFPQQVYMRSLRLITEPTATDYERALKDAISEQREVMVRFPAEWKGRRVWLPAGTARLVDGKPLQSKDGWIQIQVGSEPIRLAGIARS
jgi:hypothetical protein